MPIGVIGTWIVSTLFRESVKQAKQTGEEFGRQVQRLQDRTKRIGELEALLEDHYQMT